MIRRKSGNKTYWYIAESHRVNGVSRQKILRSLGTVTDINAKYENTVDTCEPVTDSALMETTYYKFGDVSALLDIAKRLDIEGIIDKHSPKRDQGLSIGSYMVLAAINRVVQPISKNLFFDWFKQTVLVDAYPKADEHTLSSQSFWNHMIELDQDAITAIEDEIFKQIIEKYGISTDCLLFDNTNFFTYIDTSNTAKIPQRGHSKEKRTDLKIVGLSLMVSPDHNIPLFHELYPGNRCDSKQFLEIIDKIKMRYTKIGDNNVNLTLIFDKGNNSEILLIF
jgi:transposase